MRIAGNLVVAAILALYFGIALYVVWRDAPFLH